MGIHPLTKGDERGMDKRKQKETGFTTTRTYVADQRRGHFYSEGLISGSGWNFDNLVDKQFIGRFSHCTILTINMLSS